MKEAPEWIPQCNPRQPSVRIPVHHSRIISAARKSRTFDFPKYEAHLRFSMCFVDQLIYYMRSTKKNMYHLLLIINYTRDSDRGDEWNLEWCPHRADAWWGTAKSNSNLSPQTAAWCYLSRVVSRLADAFPLFSNLWLCCTMGGEFLVEELKASTFLSISMIAIRISESWSIFNMWSLWIIINNRFHFFTNLIG